MMEMETMMNAPVLLTVLIFFPLLCACGLVAVRSDAAVRRFTLGAGLLELLFCFPLIFHFNVNATGFQFTEMIPWVPAWGLYYHLGVDGISLLLVVLTALMLPLCVLCSWTYIQARVRAFHFCMLLMTGACIGVFTALDLVLFYVFWEAMLIPMYLLIAVWGGPERRYASIKFFLYTLAGSTLLLVAVVAFYHQAGTFSIPALMGRHFPFGFQVLTFLAMSLAFAIKVPMFPFHTWLPAAHVEAPSAGSVFLASILLKMGAYGFLRFCLPITPDAARYFAPYFIAVSIISIIYGSLVALGQTDMKKLVAYSSVGHMGFVTLGIFLLNLDGLQGALLQMISHGITTGALFMMIGAIYERSHSRLISDNLGLSKYLPAFIGFWGIFAFSSMAFPGTSNFVGEILILIGAFKFNFPVAFLAVPGVVLAVAYMLILLKRTAWGEPVKGKGWPDLNHREWAYLIPLALLVFYIGLAPRLPLASMRTSLAEALKGVEAAETAFNEPALADRLYIGNRTVQHPPKSPLEGEQKGGVPSSGELKGGVPRRRRLQPLSPGKTPARAKEP